MSERWFVAGEDGGEPGMVAVEKWEGSGEVVSRSIAVSLLEFGWASGGKRGGGTVS